VKWLAEHPSLVFSVALAKTMEVIDYPSGELREHPSEALLANGQLHQATALMLEF